MLFSCTFVIIYLCDSWNKTYLIVNTGEHFTQLGRRVHKFVTNISLINSWAPADHHSFLLTLLQDDKHGYSLCFESAFIKCSFQTAGELEMNDLYTGNSRIILFLSQEPCTSPISPNRPNQYWVLTSPKS